MTKVNVYSTKTCPYCTMLKRWLDSKGVAYTNYNVDEDGRAANEMISLSGQMGVPFTTIEDDEGKVSKVLGFDVPKLEALFNKA